MYKIVLLSSLIFSVSFTACKSHTEEKREESKFKVTSPVLIDTSFTKEYVAQIQSIQNVEIRANVKGYLEKINIDEGRQARSGQVLFNIMPKQYEAVLMKARANARTAEIEYQNVKTLTDKNIVSKAELAIAQSKWDEAKAEVALAEIDVSFTKIKAPFDGTIDRIPLKIGSLIEEGDLLTSISNNKEVYAYFNVSEVEYLAYKSRKNQNEKETATLLLANNQPHKYKGTIETIESEFESTTGNIAFRAKFPNPNFLLKHGETGRVQLMVNLQNALVIPQVASFEIQDKIYVYVVDEHNIVRSRNITIKQKLPNLYVIESGLSSNEKILLEGIQSVKEDQKIQTEFIPSRQVMESLQLIKQ